MGYCKKDVTPLLTHGSYVFLALTHRYVEMYSLPQQAHSAYSAIHELDLSQTTTEIGLQVIS